MHALRQIGRDDLGLITGDADVIAESVGHAQRTARERKPAEAPEFSRVVARIAMRRKARRRHRLQLADLVGLIVVEAAVRAEQEIFVDRVDRRQSRAANRRRHGRRQRLGPTMHMDDRPLRRQRREQLGERRSSASIPGTLHQSREARGIAEQIGTVPDKWSRRPPRRGEDRPAPRSQTGSAADRAA